MKRHDAVVGHQHDDGVDGIFVLTRHFSKLLQGHGRCDASEVGEPTLNKRVLKRGCDGLRNLKPTVSVDFQDLAKTKQEGEHDGQAAEGLADVRGCLKVHARSWTATGMSLAHD